MGGLMRPEAVWESSMIVRTASVMPSRNPRESWPTQPPVVRRRADWALFASGRSEPEPLVIGERAVVLHDGDSRGLEDVRDVLVADPELEPHDLGPRAHREDVLDVSGDQLGAAEHIDEVDRLVDLGERLLDRDAEQLLAGQHRI